jgi:hypothetical protein
MCAEMNIGKEGELRKRLISGSAGLYIKELLGPGTKCACRERGGFFLDRKEKCQPFGDWIEGWFPIAALINQESARSDDTKASGIST